MHTTTTTTNTITIVLSVGHRSRMPCVLKIKVIEARNLPVMDKNTELADAYVEVKQSNDAAVE
jgi:hypothetical protein